MKKKYGFIAVIIMLSMLLSSCKSDSETINKNSDISVANTDDKPIKASNSYKQGIFTESLYYSEWLNLRFEISSDFEASPETAQAYNESQSREIVEMMIDSENRSMFIFVIKNSSNKSLNQFAEEHKKSVEDGDKSTTSKIQNYTINRTWESATYNLVGTEYLLLSCDWQNYIDGEPYRKGTSWNLFRQIDDYFVQIQCMANDQSAIEKLLAGFTTYADGTDTSSDMKENGDKSSETEYNSPTNTSADNNSNESDNVNNTTCANGHTWKEATCTEPATCMICGITSGSAKGHTWKEATCTEPAICMICGITSGYSMGHSWVAIVQTVHHDATGHYETVTDAKKVSKYRCPMCGYNQPLYSSLDDYYLHVDSAHENTALYSILRDRYEIVERWEYFDTEKWVVDSESYDETVITGYRCSVCGKQKSS